MKKLFLIYYILISCYQLDAQSLDYFKKIYSGNIKLTSITQINTSNDFDQTGMSIENVDSTILHKMKGTGIGDFDIPINLKSLKYLGKKNPKDIIEFYVPNFERDMPMINKEVAIFNYDGNWIIVQDTSSRDLLNVFFCARAFEILKLKYPEAYKYLINPNQIELGYKKLNPADFKPTLNKLVAIISFDKSPLRIAGSLWNQVFAKEQTVEYNGVKSYENKLNALTSINYETERPKEIYGKADMLENYWLYLREGLVESIAHEFTHHYITNFKLFDRKAEHIFKERIDTIDKSFSVDVEEAIVINTIENYFIKKGGLSNSLTNFNINIKYNGKKVILSDMTKELNRIRFENLKTLSPPTSNSFDEVYRLDFF